MARPTKWRKIEHIPSVLYFVPSAAAVEGPQNVLKMEELEAIRLKDLEGLEQEECAVKMGVSRPTFQRILILAREKIADSLINGKAIHVEGGSFTRNICLVKCLDCEKEWDERYEALDAVRSGTYACPTCGSLRVTCGRQAQEKFCRRNCRRHGRTD